jgi:radical SAM superfamily enzyme
MGTLAAANHAGSCPGSRGGCTWCAVGGFGSGNAAKVMRGCGHSHPVSWP